jgi:hypothetical protein
MVLWLTAMNCYHTAQGITSEEDKFKVADNLFRGGVISALHSTYEDNYLCYPIGKKLWDALDAKFGVSDTSSELYVMEQLFNYKIVDNHSVVKQAHEIQVLAKELEQFPCVLPDKFVADSIIAKLPPSWRQEFSTRDKSLA